MKYRIVQWYNGEFALQKKLLFWWVYIKVMRHDDYEIITFDSEKEAREWVKQPYDDSIVKIIEV